VWRTFVSLLWVVLVLFMIFVRFCALSLQLVILPAAGEWCRLTADHGVFLMQTDENITTSLARCFYGLIVFQLERSLELCRWACRIFSTLILQ